MASLKYKLIPEGDWMDMYVPVSVAFVDYADVKACGLSLREACEKVAAQFQGPVAINVVDLDATTTNSDGIMLEGSLRCIGAGDYGVINSEFGYLEMPEIEYSEELIAREPHLAQWKKNFPDKTLIMGPIPEKKPIPIHSAVLTGRCGNNNAGTEQMHYINMEELLTPIIGQMEIIRGGNIEIGHTGYVISVGIGMVVGEEWGRIVPHHQFECGQTAHSSGSYAKYLKSHIPCVVADKKVLAKLTIDALNAGMIPGRHIGSSPQTLSVARHKGIMPDFDNIEEAAWEELNDIGYTKEWCMEKVELLSDEEIIERAHEIIPGVDEPRCYKVDDVIETKYIEL